MKIALIHAYSAENSGDGLLVRNSLKLIRAAFDHDAEVTLFASYPESFSDLGLASFTTKPDRRGYRRSYRRALRAAMREADLIVGVGGGYLRAPGGSASLKCALVMGPQLRAAARSEVPSIYLPQSVGPLRGATGYLVRRYLHGIDKIYLRDDRSVEELRLSQVERAPDLAILFMQRDNKPHDVDDIPVMNARTFRGEILTRSVADLGVALGSVDGLVQSAISSNSDVRSVNALKPRRVLDRHAFYEDRVAPRRVVVAMRLHCALEALNAGHYVVHLAYERKGFGAFADLGLSSYVHSVSSFSVGEVRRQVQELIRSRDARDSYQAAVQRAVTRVASERDGLARTLRNMVG